MELQFFNTMGRTVMPFIPLEPGKVGMYTCGPTVYNFAHIGNLRTYLFEDFLRRTLEYAGFTVTHVMNVTDVGHLTDDADEGEDKIVKSSRETGRSVWDIARMYTEAFFHDIDRLNIERPTIVCKATDHIPEMIELVKRLEERGYTYEAGGNIYFDIDKFPDYGKLAQLDLQELKAGARIEVDSNKRNPHDFVLWFTRSKFEHQAMLWDSPWGRGYPGWHLECSAMSMKYLGDQFDIHCGGIDHIPVHHTNEIAQSEAASGKSPWVRYWLHGEFLVIDREKMSKSKGGFLTLDRLIEEGFDPLDYRYFCLGGHYRSQLQFSFDALKAAQSARRSLVDRISQWEVKKDSSGSFSPGSKAALYRSQFQQHLANDLNTPQTLADLWAVVKDGELTELEKFALVEEMDRVLGLRLTEQEEEQLDPELEALIRDREQARKNRDFARADEIRNLLKEKGIILEDTSKGTRWKRA
ncbi:MAG: cysteine--tRNA ligase [Spirochaetales bacterium]